MKILFVYAEIHGKLGTYGFQYGLASISAYLEQNGYKDTKLFYLSAEYSENKFIGCVKEYSPDIIAFYSSCDQFKYIKRLLKLLQDTDIFTICGGPHPSIFPQCIYESDRLNAICIGEGEGPMLDLVKALEKGETPFEIKNLWIRDGTNIIKNEARPFIEDINLLPFVDREIFERVFFVSHYGLKRISYKNSFRITRGCPFQCTFCSNKLLSNIQKGLYVRFLKPDRLIKEIKNCINRYNIKDVYFLDDTFILNDEIIKEFCDRYKREINLPFDFFARIPIKNYDILKALKWAGGRRISFGIESGNEKFRRDVLNKKFTNNEILEVFAYAKSLGFQTEAFVMTGLPDETSEIFEDTKKLLTTIQPDLYTLKQYFPIIGTELYDYAKKKGYIGENEATWEVTVNRDAILDLPFFSKRLIKKKSLWFGYDIYKNSSYLKALLFLTYESRMGDFLLKLVSLLKDIFDKKLDTDQILNKIVSGKWPSIS